MHSIAILSFIARRRFPPLIPIVGAHLYFRKAHLAQLPIEPIIKHDSIGLTECQNGFFGKETLAVALQPNTQFVFHTLKLRFGFFVGKTLY